jgi:hypothetical protein
MGDMATNLPDVTPYPTWITRGGTSVKEDVRTNPFLVKTRALAYLQAMGGVQKKDVPLYAQTSGTHSASEKQLSVPWKGSRQQ